MKKLDSLIIRLLEKINYKFNSKTDKKLNYIFRIRNNYELQEKYTTSYIRNNILISLIFVILTVLVLIFLNPVTNPFVQVQELKYENPYSKVLNAKVTFEYENINTEKEFKLNYPRKKETNDEIVDYVINYIDDELIKGNNLNLLQIEGNLNFNLNIPYDVIIEWKSDSKYIDDLGIVTRPYKGEGDKKCKISVSVTSGNVKKVKEFNVVVFEDDMSKGDYEIANAEKELDKMINEDEFYFEDFDKEKFVLKDKINDVSLQWFIKEDEDKEDARLKIIAVLAILLITIFYLRYKQLDNKCKEIKSSYEMYFPTFIEQFIILLGVGFTPYTIINYIAENEEDLDKNNPNLFLLGIRRVSNEIKTGISFDKSIEQFAKMTDSEEIKRFAINLIFNMKKGDNELLDFLMKELENANEYAHVIYTIKAKESNIKLIFPLVINLLAVILVVTYPALVNLNF